MEEVELADPVCLEAGPWRGPPPSPEQPRSSREAFAVEATGARTGETTGVIDAKIDGSVVDNPADRRLQMRGVAANRSPASRRVAVSRDACRPWEAIRAITRIAIHGSPHPNVQIARSQ